MTASNTSVVRLTPAAQRSAGSLELSADGKSHIEAQDVKFAIANVNLAEAAEAQLFVSGTLTCKLRESSQLTVGGKPVRLEKDISPTAKLILK